MPYVLDNQIKLVSEIQVGSDTDTLYCDAIRITQVLSNLINNSIDSWIRIIRIIVMAQEYKYQGNCHKNMGVKIRIITIITIRASNLITVQDNCVRISQDKIDDLFGKFYQLDTSKH